MARVVAYASVIVLALIGVAADAAPRFVPNPKDVSTTSLTVCIRRDGSTYDPHCPKSPSGPPVCDCGADFHVLAPYCRVDEDPAPTDTDANRARFTAALAGSLENARYHGRRFCVRGCVYCSVQ